MYINNYATLTKQFLFSIDELPSYKCNDLLPIQCLCCQKTHNKKKVDILDALRRNYSGVFCSVQCSRKYRCKKVLQHCTKCKKEFSRNNSQIHSRKNNVFCSRTCSASYNNSQRTCVNSVSKLEKWLQSQLFNIFPKLHIMYNDRLTIKRELDIYIPTLQLAFEINGPHHYTPIFGQEMFEKTKANDLYKQSLCERNNINLISINTSKQLNFSVSTSIDYLNIIVYHIKNTIKQ